MNKKIHLKKHSIFLFVVNIIVFLLLVLFKTIYDKLNFWIVASNIMLFVNLIILLVGIYFNYLFVIKDYKYHENNKKIYIIISTVFGILLLFNSLGIYLINTIHDSKFQTINDKLIYYCEPDNYYCDSYEIFRNRNDNEFVAHKIYYDYNKNKNNIEIHTKYSSNEVLSVEAIVYSRKDSFSEYLIKENIKDYFLFYNYDINENMIKNAFDNRFKGKVEEDNCSYEVKEEYKKKQLYRLKTIIKLELR